MPPFTSTFHSVDPTRGVLFVSGKLIFLPWVTAIEPDEDDSKKSWVHFENRSELLVDATVDEIYSFIKKSMGGDDEQG